MGQDDDLHRVRKMSWHELELRPLQGVALSQRGGPRKRRNPPPGSGPACDGAAAARRDRGAYRAHGGSDP